MLGMPWKGNKPRLPLAEPRFRQRETNNTRREKQFHSLSGRGQSGTGKKKEKFDRDAGDPDVGAILSQVVRADLAQEVTFG